MKKLLLFFFFGLAFADVYKSDVKCIANRLEIFDAEIKFIFRRIDWLDQAGKDWVQLMQEALGFAEELKVQIKNLKKNEKKSQKLISAEFRLFKYLKILERDLKDWKRKFAKEVEHIDYDINKFNVPKKECCLKRDMQHLAEPLGCDADKDAVKKQAKRLQVVNSDLGAAKVKIADKANMVNGYYAQFDEAKSNMLAMLKNNRHDFCCFLS